MKPDNTHNSVPTWIYLILTPLWLTGCAVTSDPGSSDSTPTSTSPAQVQTHSSPDASGDSDNDADPAPTPSPTASGSDDCRGLGSPADDDHRGLFDLLNEYRQDQGLGSLQYSLTLQAAADAYAQQMEEEDFFAHVAPDGTRPEDRAQAAGYCDPYVGENLAYGLNLVSTAEQAMQVFLDSPEHDANMLQPGWDYVGIGVWHKSGLLGTEGWWVQLFGNDISND